MLQIVSHEYGVEGVGISMQGGRSENQDDLGCIDTPLGFLVMVCDGMGGGPGGKTASYIAKTTVMETLANSTEDASVIDMIKKAVDAANEALEAKMLQMPELRGMGSTMVMLLITSESAFVANLGDSRCYQIRGGKILFRTNDHSLVGELVRNKTITEEQARTSSQSNIITRGLGSTTNHVADITELPYRHGDRFVLCTDGVWGIMPQEDLRLRMAGKQEISSIVRNLSAEIDQIGMAQGGQYDNHTMAILELAKDSQSYNKMTKTNKILMACLSFTLLISVMFNIISFMHLGFRPQLEALSHTNDSLEKALHDMKVTIESQNVKLLTLSGEKDQIENTLNTSKDSNKQVNKQLIQIIDSMRVKITTLERTVATLKESKVKTDKPHSSKTTKREETMGALAECTKLLNELVRMQESSMEAAAKKVKINVEKCVELLKNFDNQTQKKYNSILGPIVRRLSNSDTFKENKNVVRNRGKNGPVFEIKPETQTAIEEIIKKLNKLN